MEQKELEFMLNCLKQLHLFSRAVLSCCRKEGLTNSELELLSLMHISADSCTPLSLSRHTGMKKEAVSRGLRRLFEKGYIEKRTNPGDERSYMLSLTKEGKAVLAASYDSMLNPLYELKEKMGEDFYALSKLIDIANTIITPK